MQATNDGKERLVWVDVLRAMAIYGVGLTHMGHLSARLSVFSLGFVVQLFFFVSGLFASHYASLGPWALVKKLARRLLLPYAVLAALNIGFAALLGDGANAGAYALQFLLGIRNRTFVPGMWFIPALVVMTLAYRLLTYLIKDWRLRLALCLAISLFFRFFKEEPEWFMSADSAMMFLFYYAMGDLLMPTLRRVRFGQLGRGGKAAVAVAAVCCGGLTVWSYFFYAQPEQQLFGLPVGPNGLRTYTFVVSAAAIFFLLVLARVLVGVLDRLPGGCRPLQIIGQNTLILSCVEWISSVLVTRGLALVGVGVVPEVLWQVLLYGGLQLAFGCWCIALPLRLALPWVFGPLPQKPAPGEKG